MLLNLLPTLDDNLLGLLRVVYALLRVFLFLALFLHGGFTFTSVWTIAVSRRMEQRRVLGREFQCLKVGGFELVVKLRLEDAMGG